MGASTLSLQDLTPYSELQDILAVIYQDPKSDSILDEKKFKTKTPYNRLITIEDLQPQKVEGSKSIENIKNHLRYQIAFNLGILKEDGLQGENREYIHSLWQQYYQKKQESVLGDVLEAATLELMEYNSYADTFTMFLINIVRDKYVWDPKDKKWYVKTYFKEFSVREHNDIFRDIYFLKHVDTWYREAIGDDKLAWWKLCQLAYLSHVAGNYVLVPPGFTAYSKKKHEDTYGYFDLNILLMEKVANQRFGQRRRIYQKYLKHLNLVGLDVLIKGTNSTFTHQEDNIQQSTRQQSDTTQGYIDQESQSTDISIAQDSNREEFGVKDYTAASQIAATRQAVEEAAQAVKGQFVGQGMDVIAGKTAADGVYDGVTRARRKAEYLYESKWISDDQELLLYYEGHDFHFPRPNYYRTFQWRQLLNAMIVTTFVRNILLAFEIHPVLRENAALQEYIKHVLEDQLEEQNTDEIREMILQHYNNNYYSQN